MLEQSFPSPLEGEGGLRPLRRKTDEGSLNLSVKFPATPHPALRATFSLKGRKEVAQGVCYA